jgi:hypothetical protein
MDDDENGALVTPDNEAWFKEQFEKNVSYDSACRREVRDLLRFLVQKAQAQMSRSADTDCSAFADKYTKRLALQDKRVAVKLQDALNMAER